MTAPLFPVAAMPLTISEAHLQRAAMEYLLHRKWRVVHYGPAWVGGRIMTPVHGHSGGPDIFAARVGSPPAHIECKTHRGRLTPEQELWRLALGDYWFLLRPANWPEFVSRYK